MARWWNTTWDPAVPSGAIPISVTLDDGRTVPASIAPDPTNASRARVILADGADFPNGPFGTTVDVRTATVVGSARWTLPAYGQTNVEADEPMKVQPSVAPFRPRT